MAPTSNSPAEGAKPTGHSGEPPDDKPGSAAKAPPDEPHTIEPDTGSWGGSSPGAQGPDLLVGTTLHDTYIVEGIIGEGGMGRVYKARHTRIRNKRFAIKVLHAEFSLNPELQKRFQREAEAAAAIQHPGVVGIYDLGRTPQGWPYMVCEFLEGTDLHSHIAEHGPMGDAAVVHVGRQLCSALDAAHQQGVIHRDLKPHNVFVVGDLSDNPTGKPVIKVLDFGLSRFVDHDSELTKAGIVLGTPGYMSPEQAQGHESGKHTDIYGIGAILYAACTGQPPFREKTPQMTVLAVMNSEPKRPRAWVPTVSPMLEVVIQRAMARAPNDRYQNVQDLSRALAKTESASLKSIHPVPLLPTTPPPGEAAGARPRLVFMLLGTTVLLVAWATSVALGALGLMGRKLDVSLTSMVISGLSLSAALIPLLWLLKQVRRDVWGNTARVLHLIGLVRAPLIAASSAYALSALLVNLQQALDHQTPWSFADYPTPAPGWPGWQLILPGVALLAAAISALRLTYRHVESRLARWLLGPALGTAAVLLAALALLLGVRWGGRVAEKRNPENETPPATADESRATSEADSGEVATSSERAAAPTASPTQGDRTSTAAPPQTATLPAPSVQAVLPALGAPGHAPQDLLAGAVAEGVDGLEPLSRHYPQDPALLKALVLAYASRANTIDQAVVTIQRLLRVDRSQRSDADLRFILTRAAQMKGDASRAAFTTMRREMGLAGADLLYDLMTKKPKIEQRARSELAKLRRQGKVSRALAIAYDLRFAPTCAARVPLLPRAERFGDQRSLSLLSGLSAKANPCGKRVGVACRARCPEQAEQFDAAIQKIAARRAKTD